MHELEDLLKKYSPLISDSIEQGGLRYGEGYDILGAVFAAVRAPILWRYIDNV